MGSSRLHKISKQYKNGIKAFKGPKLEIDNKGKKLKTKSYKGFLFILPSLIGFFLLYILPFILGFRYSLAKSGFDTTFVGISNYRSILGSLSFKLALKNNITFLIIGIPLLIIISFILALIIHEIKAPRIVKLAIILPIAIPSATVSGFFNEVFASGINNLLDSDYAMVAAILIFIWRGTGYNLIVYLAALTQMDKSIIEAAKIDRANYLQIVRYIIIPQVTPSTVFVSIISIINSFKVYRDLYILQGNYPNPNIYMLQHYMNNLFRALEYQKLASAAYIFSLIIFLAALAFFYVDRQYQQGGTL